MDTKGQTETVKKPCQDKCMMCENRDKKANFCTFKGRNCREIKTDFSKEECNGFLMDKKLVMF